MSIPGYRQLQATCRQRLSGVIWRIPVICQATFHPAFEPTNFKRMQQFNIRAFIIAVLLGFSVTAGAQQQNDPDLKDKIRAAEIAYLSKQLDLTPEEAQKFWPRY